MEDKLYWYWLCGKVRLPIKKQKELMDIFIHPKELYKINPAILKEHMTQLEYDRFVHSRDETAIKKGYEAPKFRNVSLYSLLARLLPMLLAAHGLTPLCQQEVPPGDGGISLGQAAWAQACLRARMASEV